MVEEMVRRLGKKWPKCEASDSGKRQATAAGGARAAGGNPHTVIAMAVLTEVKVRPRVRPKGMAWLRKRLRETASRREKPSVR